ncbi:hypothetical protein AB0F77_13355 [Streptomyces sp. NPDC026672]|uniref:hypothetical protein n=1 Tax=unclassified Streptomyces TaxID=2593676 RepID=UPI00340785D0
MFRGTTARTVVSLLAIALLALQFFAPAETFATAYTPRHAEAKAQLGTEPSAQPLRNGFATFRAPDKDGEPTGPPQTRDRHRTTGSGWAQERPSVARITVPPPTAAASGPTHRHTARPSRSHSAAALQVFRC